MIRARPAGLFRFRAQDLVWGAAFGFSLLLAKAAQSAGDSVPFPTSPLIGAETTSWFLHEAVPLGLVGPVVEELFFRAVILVSLFQILRRHVGHVSASVTAALASTGLFVCLHATFTPISLVDGLQFSLLSLVCSALVLLTGRIWAAVIAHVIYNVSFLLIVYVGSSLST
ncbi:CPBP family intramembrane glutamic endopeptidase [Microbacterium sp. NPDC090007]|uniref:CPBP family intramembrane glutamic endopeptidase n=1 Tax=Microbacterium sp. NPDC090007 TaxID=3364204 RepID=UPI00382F58E4